VRKHPTSKRELTGGPGAGREDGEACLKNSTGWRPVPNEQGAVGDHMLDGMAVSSVGSAALISHVERVAGTEGGVVRLAVRSEVHGVIGVEGVTCGELDGSGEEATVASGDTAGWHHVVVGTRPSMGATS
jgi:hypothetical protein